MKILADRRSADVEPDASCEAEAMAAAVELRAASLRTARALAIIERKGIYMLSGFASARDYAVGKLGLSGDTASALLPVGRQLDQPAAPRPNDRDGEAEGDGATKGDGATEGHGDQPSDDDGGDGLLPSGPNDEESPAVGSDGGTADGTDGADATPPAAPPPPTLEDRMRDGALSMGSARQLDRLERVLGVFSAVDRAHWSELAETMSEYGFRRLVSKTIEEHKQGAPTVSLQLHVTESARDDFRKAKALASRRAQTVLTEGQVFAAMARHFVRSLDKRAVGEKPRRTPHTKLRPGRRYVPAAVEREVLRRDDDRCSVGDCSNDIFLDLMHVRAPHAAGGSREVDDLAAGCDRHHLLHDAGVIRFVGFDERGKPVYRTRRGRLLRRSASPEDPAVDAPPLPPATSAPATCPSAPRSPAPRSPATRPATRCNADP